VCAGVGEEGAREGGGDRDVAQRGRRAQGPKFCVYELLQDDD
jgi:hypothetical protein